MLTVPSCEVRSSQVVRTLVRMTDLPDTNFTTTEAFATGLPKSLVTLIDSLVFSAAPSGNVANRNSAGNNFTMLQLCSVRKQEGLGFAGGGCGRFGREIAAADRAFHGGGPAGAGPISGQKQVRDSG